MRVQAELAEWVDIDGPLSPRRASKTWSVDPTADGALGDQLVVHNEGFAASGAAVAAGPPTPTRLDTRSSAGSTSSNVTVGDDASSPST